MRQQRLSASETALCARMRQAREDFLCLSQSACAAELGIKRSTLANYEAARTPLKCELGLRFCHQFIVSEEWLSTGKHKSMEGEMARRGLKGGPELASIFQRQSMALLVEPISRRIPPTELFSAAFQTRLAPIYAELVKTFFHVPRTVLEETDSPARNQHIVTAYFERWMKLIANRAAGTGMSQRGAQNEFTRAWLQAGNKLFTGEAQAEAEFHRKVSAVN